MLARSRSDLPLILCLALCAVVLVTMGDYGITWDEHAYSVSGHDHFLWLTHPSWKRIDNAWRPGNEHPPLGTLAGGLAEYVLHDRHALLDWYPAFRLQALLYVFIANFVLFTWVSECWGRATALVAVLSFFFLPRAFFHAHLGALDYPMTALWVVAAYAFWKGLAKPHWMLAASVFVGLTLLTKVNALFLWALLLAGYATWFRTELWRRARAAFGQNEPCEGLNEASQGRSAHVLRNLAALLLVPPVVFFIGWPWLWPHPFSRAWDYFAWLSEHAQVPVYYMGKTWMCPPWHYAFVVTAVTIPLVALIPFFVGLLRWPCLERRAAAGFLLLNGLAPIAVIAFVSSCVYDGARLWLPAFPFLCAISAVGVRELWRLAGRIKAQAAFAALYGALFAATVWFSIVRYHPYESCYFNEIVGGVDGAAAHGFETEYWGDPLRAVLPWMNAHTESTFCVPIGGGLMEDYRAAGRLAPEIRMAGISKADYLVLLVRQGMIGRDPELWEFYTRRKPVDSVKVFDTLLVGVYDMKGARKAPEGE